MYGIISIVHTGPSLSSGRPAGQVCHPDHAGSHPLLLLAYIWNAYPICRSWAAHLVRWADSRAIRNAGISMAIKIAITPITTSNSTNEKPILPAAR